MRERISARLCYFYSMSGPQLRFAPIDLDVHTDSVLQFREDSYVCSFGDASGFDPYQYLGWLKAKLEKDEW